MANYVFLNIPSRSHINPTLPLVEALLAQGDHVTYYLTEPFRALIEGTGASFRSYDSHIDAINDAARTAGKPVGLPIYMLDEALFVLPQILDEVRANPPDCIVYGVFCLAGRMLAEILRVPDVNHRVFFAFTPQLTSILEKNAAQDPAGLAAFAQQMAQAQQVYAIQPFTLASIFTHRASLNIVALPRAFQIDGESFDESYAFVGPTIAPRAEEVDFPLAQLEGQQVLYISQGTVYNESLDFFKMCIAAFGESPWTVVMSVGKNIDQSDLGSIPANFIVRGYVPQLEVLQHTSLTLTHGSMATVMESLAHGVPMVVSPQHHIADMFVNGRQVDALGLGILLPFEAASVASLRGAVARVSSDPGYRQRAQHMQREIQQAGGAFRAATLLQRFVADRAAMRAVSAGG